ncbi:MAG: hypothetical protein M1814_002573 [Vezdaea aestivalis]|nr:MAG: hypothetical protein M1814_002573 [Vezdaea aestivalis]
MSTIASPRLPPSEVSTPTTSRRTSFDFHSRSGATSPARLTGPGPSRRNRAALQAYYGLKNANTSILEGEEASVKASELDQAKFQAEDHVQKLLEREGLEGILKVENGLVGDLKSLDGERKALVYDNYSKLIMATDTIRKMRTNMDPLAPTTFNLSPAISHIAETATSLASSLQQSKTPLSAITEEEKEQTLKRQRQQQTARWALDTPRRLSELLKEDEADKAKKDWAEVKVLLETWKRKGVKGADVLWQECQEIISIENEVDDIDDSIGP